MSHTDIDIHVADLAVDEDNQIHLVFEFTSVTGHTRRIIVPRRDVINVGSIASKLLDAGAGFDGLSPTDVIRQAISESPKRPTAKLVTNHGWHGAAYVSRGKTYGKSKLPLIYKPNFDNDSGYERVAGTLKEWRGGLEAPARASSAITFVCSLPFGAALLKLLDIEGGTFVLVGESSGGKTTAARCGQSVTGRAQSTDVITLSVTDRALEELCAARTDSFVLLDEAAREPAISIKHVENLAYTIASGKGRLRSSTVANENGLVNVSWRVFALVTSESSLVAAGNKKGVSVRFFEVPVSRPNHGGVFDRTKFNGPKRRDCAKKLAAQAERTIEANYGVAMAEFLKIVAANSKQLKRDAHELVEHFVEKVGADTNPSAARIARKFAAVYAGSVLAARHKIVPWSEKHAFNCIRRIYRRAQSSQNEPASVGTSLLKKIARGIQNGHFPPVKKGHAATNDVAAAWGFRRVVDNEAIVAVPIARLKNLAGASVDLSLVLSLWTQNGIIVVGADGKHTRQLASVGWSDGRKRFVCLRLSSLPNSNRP